MNLLVDYGGIVGSVDGERKLLQDKLEILVEKDWGSDVVLVYI